MPWTNRSDDREEEQSGHVHVVGFLVTHVDTETNKKGMTARSRTHGFCGWDPQLLPPQGRPISSWEATRPPGSRTKVHAARKMPETAQATMSKGMSAVTAKSEGATSSSKDAQLKTKAQGLQPVSESATAVSGESG